MDAHFKENTKFMTNQELAEHLRQKGLRIGAWQNCILPVKTLALIKMDQEQKLELFDGEPAIPALNEVFLPTQFGSLSGFTYAYAMGNNEFVYGVGVRIFIECHYLNPDEWIWKEEMQEQLLDAIHRRLNNDIYSLQKVDVERDIGMAAAILTIEGDQPLLETEHLIAFLASYVESGKLDADIQHSFYAGWQALNRYVEAEGRRESTVPPEDDQLAVFREYSHA